MDPGHEMHTAVFLIDIVEGEPELDDLVGGNRDAGGCVGHLRVGEVLVPWRFGDLAGLLVDQHVEHRFRSRNPQQGDGDFAAGVEGGIVPEDRVVG